MDLLSCDGTFEVTPRKIEPLPPPAPGMGVQLYSGGWPLPAESEDEVCFVTYYDFSDSVPEDVLVPCPQFGNQTCFAYANNELAQDAQSHHSIIDACPLLGGATTDDEMFIPLGGYYVAQPEPG